jgi:hypothetical protein
MFCRGSDLWLGGVIDDVSGNGAYGYWNGSSFTVGSSADLVDVQHIWRSTDGEVYATNGDDGSLRHASAGLTSWPAVPGVSAYNITGTSSSDITITSGSLGAFHFSTTWSSIPGSSEIYPNAIAAVPGTSPTRTIHVGDSVIGGVIECTPAGCTPSLIPTEQNLFAVWAVDEKHAFIVGKHGTILY